MRNQTRPNLFKPVFIFLAGLCLALLTTTALAATVTLKTDDASGTSSITGSTNWDNNAAPNAGNDYFSAGFTINTPTSAASFAGKSLTINTGGQLQGKFSSSGTLTIPKLILAGGSVRQAGSANNFSVGIAGSAFMDVSSASSLGTAAGSGQLTINAFITNSGALLIPDVSTDTGNVRFQAANPYSGTLTVSNNSFSSALNHLLLLNNVDAVSNATVNLTAPANNPVAFGAVGATFNLGALTGSSTQALTNTAGAAVTLSIGWNNGSGTFSGALTDSGALTKVGSGTLILNGANSYSGNTTVSAGALVVSSAQSGTGNISVANGATLGVVVSGTSQLSPTNLTLGISAGATLILSNMSSTSVAPISATNVSFAGTLTLNVNGSAFVAGNNYPLITWSGTGPVVTNGIALNATGLPPRSTGALAIVSKTLYLQINSAQPLSWATGNGTWDVNNSGNAIWKDRSGVTTYYQEGVVGDQVLFDNTVGLGGIVTLNTTVAPAAVTVSNATTSYTFSGSGAISGSTGLTKTGAGTLIITTTNTYNGVTAISGGTLQLGDGTANTGVVAGDITNNAALVFANPTAQTFAGAISGSGTLTKSAAGTLTLSGANTYTGNTIVSAGELLLSSAQSGTGNISVADGAVLGLLVSVTSQMSPAALTLGTSAGATLEFNGLSSTLTAPINAASVSVAGTLTVNINSGGFNAGNSYPLVSWTGAGLVSTNGLALNLPFGVQGYLLVSGNTLYLQTIVRAVPTPAGFNYEVYPGSAFYMTQMVDSASYPYTAQFANGFYFHPVGFSIYSDYTLSTAQKQQICNNFSNQFSIGEGDMGFTNPNPGGTMGTIAGFGMTPILDFVNEATYNNALWRQVIASCGRRGGAASVMTPPHRVDTWPLGWLDPHYDPLRTNILTVGCSGSGVDAPVHLYVHNSSKYRQVIWDQRDQTVSYAKKFIYILSPNSDVGPVFMTNTLITVRSLEDNGHEPNIYTPELYGRHPVNLTPETTNYNGVVQANWTITGLAYYLLKHRDGEPGTLDLYAVSNGVSYAKGVISPVLNNAAQILPLNPALTKTYTLNLTNSSQWLDYAGVLRARASGQLTNWNVTFKIGSTDITSNVLSNNGYLFLGAQRLMPQTNQQVTLTIGPKGAAQPLDLVVEALPHAGVNQALDILAFQYQTNQTPPSMALWNVDRNSLQGVNMEPIWFTVGDAETIASNLTVTVSSSNQQLVPNTNCAVNISGVQRVLTVSPVSTQWGSTVISVAVSDGTFSVTNSFNYFVQRTTVLPVLKANNTTNLDLAASWVGNTLPGPYDQAIWTNIITGPSTTTFGNDIVWSGLQVANAGGPVAVYGTNTLILNAGNIDLSASSYDLTFNCPLDLEGAGAWNVPSSRTITFNQPVTGGGGFSLSNGKLVFAATNSFVGAVRISNGTVYMPNAGAQSLTTLDNSAVLKIANSGSLGSGGLTFAGATSAQLQMSNNISVLGGKSISLGARITSIPAVLNVGGTNQFGGTTTYEPGGGNYWFQSDAGQLILSGTITSHASGNRATTLRGVGSGSVTGVIQDGSATMQVYKDGSGTWDLNGDQTYSGVTTINAGTLTVSGSIASTNTLTALPGTTFGGTGTLACPVVITNATLAPGVAGIGAMTVNNDVTLNDGSQTVMRLSKLPVAYDAVVGVSNMTYAGSLLVTNVAGVIVPGDTFQLFAANNYLGSFTNIILPPLGYGLIWSNTLAVDGTISVVLTNGLIWRGTNSVWDVNNAGNLTWLSVLDHVTPQNYNENGVGGPVVQFDDTVGTGVTNVTLGVTVKPVSVTVSNSTRNYSITGAGKISGTAALTKIGGGTLTFGVTSDYTSGTTLGGGLLRLNNGAGLPANGALALTGSAALDLGRNAQSIGTLTFNQPANATVVVSNGSLTISDVTTIGGTASKTYNVLDMRKAFALTFNQPANDLSVGGLSSDSGGEWYLPTNAVITVNQLLIGRKGASGTSTNHGWIHLGQSNVINADSIYLAKTRSDGTLDFATNFTSPTLTLRGVTGGSSRVSWIRVGDNSSTTTTLGRGLLDLNRGAVDALIGTLEVGTITDNSQSLGKGTFNFSNGVVDATTIVLGRNYTAGGTGGPNGTFNQNSGTVKVQSLVLGDNAGLTGTPNVVGNYNLNGGTLRAQSIGLGVGTINSNSTQNLNWNAGVIKNYDTATDLSVNGQEINDSNGNLVSINPVQINLGTGGYQAFDVDAGRTMTMDSDTVISAAAPVTFYKTGSGTLLINGTDNNAGSLVVSNGTFGGTGVVAGTVSVRSGATLSPGPGIGTLTVSNLVLAGNAAFEIDLTTLNQNDSVVASGTLTNAGTGTLTVVNTGGIALSDGDTFDLFNKPLANAGALQVSLPPLDPSLYWINNLAVDGTVVVATKPVLNWQTTTTNSIVFSWPTNSGAFHLQTQTNSLAQGLGTNWVNVIGGSNPPVNIRIGTTNGSVFFRLTQ